MMDAYTFVESIRQGTILVLPIVCIPLMLMFIYTALERLSARSHTKAFEERKYKRKVPVSTIEWTKSELELTRLKEVNAR